MEDILSEVFVGSIHSSHRILRKIVVSSGDGIGKRSSLEKPNPIRWKAALWDRQSIEPAMLRVPIVIIVFLFLWTMNLWILEKNRMQYLPALSLKSAPIFFTFVTGLVLFALYATNMSIVANFLSLPVEEAIVSYYLILVLMTLISGLSVSSGQETRTSFFRLIKLCIFPGNSISFAEVVFADALTSLSKVFKDFGVTMIAIYAHFQGIDIVSLHDIGMILIALLASFPFWVRVRQCWVQYDGCIDPAGKLPILLNIIKYISGFPPIWIAAAASLGYFNPNLPTISAIMATINSLYSFTWDIVMDWGLISYSKTSKRLTFRNRILWPLPTYFIVSIMNLILRFTWASNRLPFFNTLHASHLVLIVELLEVFRRAVWNFYRIEWEVIVQQDRMAANSRI